MVLDTDMGVGIRNIVFHGACDEKYFVWRAVFAEKISDAFIRFPFPINQSFGCPWEFLESSFEVSDGLGTFVCVS